MAEIIVALDHASAGAALALVDLLPGLRWAKVGATLFASEGPGVIAELRARDIKVFLDLKWHDIPHQVGGAVEVAAGLGVELATVHALGGEAMLRSAAKAARGSALALVAVTVLTSLGPEDLAAVVGRDGPTPIERDVERLTRMARDAGLDGVVASADEAAAAHAVLGDEGLVVVPGVRLAGAPAFDQRRTADAASAVAAGASHLVVGRPVTRAERPRAVYEKLLEAVT